MRRESNAIAVSILFCLLGAISGCTKNDGGTPPPPPPVAPTITTQPASQTVTAGQTATFTVVAAGTSPLSYQWQKNGAAIPGATSPNYTTPATTAADNGAQFVVVVSNTAGSISSSAATLTVNVPPAITTQPASQTVTAGQTATFSVVATGTPSPSYQWTKNGAAISGATSSSYTTPVTTIADNGASFTVTVSNTAGSVTSTPAILTVNPPPNPTPTISSTAPTAVRTGHPGEWTLTVIGTGFVSGSTVQVNGGSRTTTFVSDTKLTASMPAIDAATSGPLAITVVSPAPGGGTSNTATVIVDTTVSVAKAASLILTDPDPSHHLGVKVKAIGNFFADGKNAVAIAAYDGIYLLRDPDSHPGNFTVSQVGSALLPGVKFVYNGPATSGISFYNIGGAGGDFDHDGIKDFLISVNVATSDPVNKFGAGMVFALRGGGGWPTIGPSAVVDLNVPSPSILHWEGEGAKNFAGQSMADGGDLTGDGNDDIAFSAPGYGGGSGIVYEIYGKPNFFSLFNNQSINLAQVSQQVDGRRITRNSPVSLACCLGSSGPGSDTLTIGGDMNRDGIRDLVIGDMSAQNRTPNTEKTYVVFGDPNAPASSFIEDIGVLFGGATFQTDHSGCSQGSGSPCFGAFGLSVSGRDHSIMVGSLADWLAGQTPAGSVFISEQQVTNGQVIDIRTAAQNLQATSLWNMHTAFVFMGSTIVDGADIRLIGSPNFDILRGALLFVPSSLPGGNLDVASVISFTLTGENQNDFFSKALARAENGSIVVGAPGSSGNPGKFYYFSASSDPASSPNLLF